MAQDTRDLLYGILKVVTEIKNNSSSNGSSDTSDKSKDEKSDSSKNSGIMSSFLGKDAKPDDIKDMGQALKVLAKGVGALSSKVVVWWAVPKKAKKSLIDFMEDLLHIAGTKLGAEKARIVADSMAVIGDALPELAKGVLRFGMMAKLGMVTATVMGITALFGVLATFGAGPQIVAIAAAAAALAGVGVALIGISKVLDSVAKIMLAFGASIITMVGAIYLASKLFKTDVWGAMLIIGGTILMLGVIFAGLGVMGPLIALGGIAVAAMGTGLLTMGLGFLSFFGGMALLQNLLGLNISEMILSMIKPIFMLGLVFAGLGLVSMLIIPGALAGKLMGTALLFMSAGMAAIGLVGIGLSKLADAVGIKDGVEGVFTSMARGIMKMGGALSIIGLLSPLIYLGSGALILMSISIGLFALVALGIGGVIAKIESQSGGLQGMQDNIADLIGGVIQGTIRGISKGLLGEDSADKSFWQNTGKVAGNVVKLMGGIVLLMGLSYALTMFAFAVKA